MRSGPILAFVLMTVASSALAETSIDYEEIKRILQDLLPQEEAATNFIRPEKRSLPLCASCPAVAAPASGCKTSLAPKFGPIKGESGCVCLKKYECCPATCPSIKDVTCSGKISKKPTCETTSGKKCVFPFIYGKKTYNKCTKVGGVGGKAWCATSVDSSGKYKAWENCSTKCTDESTDESTSEGDFYTEAGTDCCDCPTRTCVACPPPRPESSLACDQCYHYQRRHQQQEVTQCWVAGCKKDKPIVYSDPGCDTKCQTVSTVKDDCDTEKKICVDQPAPLGCTPPEPVKKQCFNAPKKVHLDVYYSKGGVCKRCWKWEVTPKPEQCSQMFSLDDACPAAHKKVLGVTTCNTPRDVCLPCTGFVPVCTQCEEKVAVKDECGFEMDTCIKKTCPSISKWTGQECGPLKIVKDACGCENIDCGKILNAPEAPEAPICTGSGKMDIQLIVDASGSIGKENFRKQMDALADNLIPQFDIGANKTRFALYRFSNQRTSKSIYRLNSFTDLDSLQKATKATEYPRGKTYTAYAMKQSLKLFKQNMRKDALKACFIFTDGMAQDWRKLDSARESWEKEGIKVYAIGLGKDIKKSFLATISGDASRVLHSEDFAGIGEVIKPVLKTICKSE